MTCALPISDVKTANAQVTQATTAEKKAQAALEAAQAALKAAQAVHKSFDFSLFYALGISLVGEGLFSAIYHVCPTPVNFQFDTSFMFAMCSLSILASYQQGESWGTVKAARYMLFYYGPLLWFTYLGVISDKGVTKAGISDNEKTPAPALWVAVLAWEAGLIWYILSSFHPDAIDISKQHDVFNERTRCCLSHNDNGCPTRQCCKCWVCNKSPCLGRTMLITLCLLAWVATLVFAFRRFMDTPSFFLTVHVSLTIAWSIGWGLYRIGKEKNRAWRRVLCLGINLSLFIVLIIFALVFFVSQVSDKATLPQQSRLSNKDCDLGIYDTHDVWHVLGGLALFFLFITVYIINPHPEFLKRRPLAPVLLDGGEALTDNKSEDF